MCSDALLLHLGQLVKEEVVLFFEPVHRKHLTHVKWLISPARKAYTRVSTLSGLLSLASLCCDVVALRENIILILLRGRIASYFILSIVNYAARRKGVGVANVFFTNIHPLGPSTIEPAN